MSDLNAIPQDKTKGFPTGVSEAEYKTEAEVRAFCDGLDGLR
jgi:hypothetical protein